MISVGSLLPAVTLMEYPPAEHGACSTGPQAVDLRAAAAGKTIALFAVPGAFTPTCSERHLPGYLALYEDLRAAGVDEIWCTSVNDAFVMNAWGREQGVQGKLRLLADGDAALAQAMGLTLDLSGRGLGLRSQRYSALLRDGVVEQLNVEVGGKFEVSDAQTLLAQLSSARSGRP